MPLFISEFQIDRVDLQHCRKPEELIDLHIAKAAGEFGRKIVETFPYINDPYQGEIPKIAVTRDHQYKDRYKLELFVMTREQRDRLVDLIHFDSRTMIIDALKEIDSILKS